MRVLVVGGGGREHALVHSFAQSPLADRIFCAPGNAGTGAEADNIPVAADDLPALLEFASREEVDLTVIGPEAPLVIGLTDLFEEHGLAVFGPNKEAAQLEGSKVFAKEVMAAGGVLTGAYRRHDRVESAITDVEGREDYPLVVKADGLAAGKGVLICKNKAEARAAVEACFVSREFGDAGDVLITEEYLTGSEVSLLVLCDGADAVPLAPAQDYKRIFAGDRGPNTGGMGSYCPVPGFERKAIDAAMELVVEPVVAALRKRGVTYRGVLYAGLIVTDAGVKVLEFNCRFGDPETQAVLPRLDSDLLEHCAAAANGELGGSKVLWRPQDCVTVVLASAGYPASSRKGDVIDGLDAAAAMNDVTVFHAGTALQNGQVVTAGGRVLAVSALGDGFAAARERAYDAIGKISFDGMQVRPDIAERAVKARAGELDLFPAGFGRT
ncbi:MAG TPA: phosphoribosylamine--glycine ligase [Thermoleophilia bacterium]|nr:phosphoribosylamine--glycine ligase [Thermoleophilia bacterium]